MLALHERFERDAAASRCTRRFGAVGAMRDALRAGAPCDVFDRHRGDDRLAAGERRGCARLDARARSAACATALAVRAWSDRRRRSTSAEALKAAAARAPARSTSPTRRASTAGAHVAAIARAARHRASARAAPAHVRQRRDAPCVRSPTAADAGALGCTQATEIRYTPGIVAGRCAAGAVRAWRPSTAPRVATVAASDDLARRFIDRAWRRREPRAAPRCRLRRRRAPS